MSFLIMTFEGKQRFHRLAQVGQPVDIKWNHYLYWLVSEIPHKQFWKLEVCLLSL